MSTVSPSGRTAVPSAKTPRRRLVSSTAVLAILLLEAASLTGCAANTVSQGPVQGPVPIPRTKPSRNLPEPPPVRERLPPTPSPEATPKTEHPTLEATAGTAEIALLQSTLWVQTAEEYRGAALQAYLLARRNLEIALGDDTWTATAGGSGNGGTNKPPAIVLDVDETVLDNAPFEARRILDRQAFSREAWFRWCLEAAAEAVPGALELTRYADSRGVAVFYITNRDQELEESTRANLRRLGFPLGSDGEDRVLTRGERPDWGSEKEPRRRLVTEGYRVLLLIGDDLGDFVAGARSGRSERSDLFESHRDRWGRQWILLPNPTYGSWERALFEGTDDLSDEEKLHIKLRSLDPRR